MPRNTSPEKSLLALFPLVAAQADGWDPSQYTCGSGEKKEWLCQCGHKWLAQICKRANGGRGCPRCAGKVITLGKNDLASQYPRIASEACDWNPQEVSRMSDKVLKWKCAQGHEWMASVKNRTTYDSRCPVCIQKILVSGVNDLASKFPSIAAEAHGWDPSQVRYGSDKKREWQCHCGNIFIASPNNRTNPSNGTSCPCCAEYGYKPSKPAWLYLVGKDGEQKVGISNVPKTRLAAHRGHGFTLLELRGPMDGFRAKEIESTIKDWIKNQGIVVEGTQENWRTDDMRVSSLLDLGRRAGLDQSSLELLS